MMDWQKATYDNTETPINVNPKKYEIINKQGIIARPNKAPLPPSLIISNICHFQHIIFKSIYFISLS